jgi:hypothetical protein
LHTSGKLTLAQARAATQRPDGKRNLDLLRRIAVVCAALGDDLRGGYYRLRLIVERCPALATIIIIGPELDEMTMVASHHLS